ncbi:cheY-like receiver [Candidatus Scalindua japonica]|uniref:CheY-like receiver n=1 Tax=Candidatus Scalindua japonica TaxID=1284222 RepID=A0A286TUD7_9BACT|nr:response regulator [Candidatus Scalindua japonica]GAX59509.1 cheY-like receiver [Candidatus Scalindua japonica]
MRILVIDDDKAILKLITTMLNQEGYDLITASNGKEGLQLLSQESGIDLVICDMIMPEKEGVETIHEIKQDYPNIKVLATSGGGYISGSKYLTMAQQLGADTVLKKPFVYQQLVDAVQELLGTK